VIDVHRLLSSLSIAMPHLTGLGFAFVILDIDPRVSPPGCFENGVAGACLARLAKIDLAHFLEVSKPDIGWFASHLFEDFFG
jgi:hypothetical protein